MDGPWTWNYKTLFNRSKDRESHTGRRDRKKEEKYESIIITDFFLFETKKVKIKDRSRAKVIAICSTNVFLEV